MTADNGLKASLGRAARSLADQASLHGELFWVEWKAERSRILKVLLVWVLSILFASFTVMFLSISALAAAWDTPYRLHVALALAAAYLAGFLICRSYLPGLSRQGHSAFSATRAQFAEEAVFLKSLL